MFGHSWLFGFGLLPQAGAAIGLAIAARQSLGVRGEEIMTIILAAVAFFELVGPVAVRFSLTRLGEAGLATNEADRASRLSKKDFTKILVPTAGPIPAARMMGTIGDLALKLEATVLVIYVQRTSSIQDIRKGEEALALFHQLENKGVKIETRIMHSENVPAKIVEVAKSENVDLIVMGATRASWLRKRVLGSITERVMLEAPCPVLEVPFEKHIS
jgi:nucleotide-binding universal stress UspA family protein